MKRKLVFLGLDAVSWRLIEECASSVEMQNFETLQNMSTQYGTLSCLDPIVSPSSWTTIATGKLPEEHWIFDFFNLDENFSRYMTTAADKNPAVMSFWEFFENPIVLHYPCTFPPEKGLRMASGMLTSKHELGISNESFKQYFSHHFPRYDMVKNNAHLFRKFSANKFYLWPLVNNPISLRKTQERFYAKEVQYLDEQVDVFTHFLKKGDFDLLAFVTASPDVAGHLLYSNRTLLSQYMKRLDEHMGTILELIKDKNFFVCSDHGMRFFSKNIFINQLLNQWGLQNYKRVNLFFKKPVIEKSEAFFLGHGMIFLNTKEKFKNGLLSREEAEKAEEKIIQNLKKLKDPSLGIHVIKSIYKLKKKKGGKSIFPDLIIECVEGYELTSVYNYFGDHSIDTTFDYRSGTHHREGMYAYYNGSNTAVNTDIKTLDVFDLLSSHFIKDIELIGTDF